MHIFELDRVFYYYFFGRLGSSYFQEDLGCLLVLVGMAFEHSSFSFFSLKACFVNGFGFGS